MSRELTTTECNHCNKTENSERVVCDNCGSRGEFIPEHTYGERDMGWLKLYWHQGSSFTNFRAADLCPICRDELLTTMPKVIEAANRR